MKTISTQNRIGAAVTVWSFLIIVGIGMSSPVQAQYPNQYPNNGEMQNRRDGRDDRYDRNRNRRGRNWDNYGRYGGSFDLRQTALNAGYNEGMRDGTVARQGNRNSNYRNQSSYRKATKDYSSRLGDRELYRRYFREAYDTGFNDGLNPQGISEDNRDWSREDNRDRNQNRNDDRDWSREDSPDRNQNRNDDRDWSRDDNRDRNRNDDRDRDNNDQNRRGRNWDRYDNYGGSFELRQTALNAGYNEGIKEGRADRNNSRSDFRNKSAYQKATADYSSNLGDRELYQRYYRAGYENGYYDGLNGN